jgi:mono/diheme cytochrome c family protein
MKLIALKTPSPCLSPQGERGRPDCPRTLSKGPQPAPSPLGERAGVRGDFSRAASPAKFGVALAALLLTGCDLSMTQQPKYTPETPSQFWANGTSARPIPANTVAQGDLAREAAAKNPPPVTLALLARGQQRFDMFCSPCHGLSGYGDGMVVQRGFPHPPSFYSQRLLAADVRHFFNVQTKGFGVMYSYADRVSEADRWAIAAYIRALQVSQHATLAMAPEAAEKVK